MLDIKHLDEETHKMLTGKDREKVQKFLDFISANNKSLWIRQVLVPDISMSDEYIDSLIDFLKQYKVEKVELLPYHEMGKEKYEKLGIPYPLNCRVPEKEEVSNIRNKFIKNGFNAV